MDRFPCILEKLGTLILLELKKECYLSANIRAKQLMEKNKNSWIHQVKTKPQTPSIVHYCVEAFPVLGSRTAVKKAIGGGRLFCNGRLAGFADRVKKGDRLELKGSGQQKARKFDLEMEVVYEDEYILVVNKPAGIAVNGNRIKTVENAVAHRNQGNRQTDVLPRPVAVHRLDVPTLGLVILAKTKAALIEMSKAFQHNQVKKTYLAVVHGETEEKGSIDSKVNDKKALTHFERMRLVPSRIFQHFSLLALYPQTGRTHQLRIHLKEKGHFIVGDKLYAEGQKTILGKGLFLCAASLEFRHPFQQEMIQLKIPLPAKFERVLDREEKRFGSKTPNKVFSKKTRSTKSRKHKRY